MALLLIALFNIAFIICGLHASVVDSNAPISSVFKAFGYSPACVSGALTTCELSSKKDSSISVVDLIVEMKSLLQEMNVEREKEKKILQEMRDDLENITYSLSKVEILLEDESKDAANLKNCTPTADNSSGIASSLASIETAFKELEQEIREEKIGSSKLFKNCGEIKRLVTDPVTGVRTVYPNGKLARSIKVLCDQTTEEGGWTVLQNRDVFPIRENFSRSWKEYVEGFGDLRGEFWLGLENIHSLTSSTPMELRIDLEDWEGVKRWAKYQTFNVGDVASQFVLKIGNYYGDAGDAMANEDRFQNMNGMKFSTYDEDNDLAPGNCAYLFKGGWWFNTAPQAHVNGYQYKGEPHLFDGAGIIWQPFRGWRYSLKKASLKIRPVSNRL